MCVYEEDFKVKIISGKGKYSPEELFSIIVGLTLMLIVLAIILAHLYRRFRKKAVVL
jgi:hypothetical protein